MARNGDGVYVRKNRPGFWISYKDVNGRRCRRPVEARTMEQAKSALGAERVRAEMARTLGFAPPTEATFPEVAQQYLTHQKARITAANYERERGIVEDHLEPFFVGELRTIRRATVQRYITARLAHVSNGTVTKELNVLKHLLELAVNEWEYIPVNPARRIRPPKAPPGRVRYLQPTELRAVLESCPEWLRVVVVIAVATGMRRSEILHLRRLDVDLMQSRVLLPQTKNGEGRIVYLNKMARAAIRSIPFNVETRPADLLFRHSLGRKLACTSPACVAGWESQTSTFTISGTRPHLGSGCRAPTFTPSRNCSGIRI